MPKPWTCPYCKKEMDADLILWHEPACKVAAQMKELLAILKEGPQDRVELKPEGERDEKLKCPQCYIWWSDEHAIAIHIPLCKLVNEARILSNALKNKEARIEKALGQIVEVQERIAAALEDLGEKGILAYDAGKH